MPTYNNQWFQVLEPRTDFTTGKCVVKVKSWPTEQDKINDTNQLPLAMCLFTFAVWDYGAIETLVVNNYANWMPYDEELIEALLLPTKVFNLTEAKAEKSKELANARLRANLTSFTYNGKNYSASQTAQNDLNAIANYASLFNALPSAFPNAWVALDGAVIAIPDVAAFKALYSAMVAQGSANFIKMQTLLYQAIQATTQASLDAVTW